MCTVADALITEGIQKGKVELLYEMDYSVAEIAEKLNLLEVKVQELLQK